MDLLVDIFLANLYWKTPFDPNVAMTRSSLKVAWMASQVKIATVTRRLTAAYITVIPEELKLLEVEVLHHQRLSMYFGYKVGVVVSLHKLCSQIIA